jgi:hypothetical protein
VSVLVSVVVVRNGAIRCKSVQNPSGY